MKRIITLIIMVLVFAKIAAGAYAEKMVSVTELREQIEGNWVTTIKTGKGEVHVDIPVIIPKIDEVPILEIEPWTLQKAGFFSSENGKQVYKINEDDTSIEYEDPDLIKFIDPELENSVPSTFFVIKNNVMLQAGHEWVYVRRGGKLKYNYKTFYPFEQREDMIYAEENPNNLETAKHVLKKVLDYYYPDEYNEFDIDYLEIRERARNVKEASDLGGYVDEYPMGTYYLSFRQMLHGLPIFTGVSERIDSTSNNKLDPNSVNKCLKIEGISLNYFEYMSDESFNISVCWTREKNVIERDVPLLSLNEIFSTIEREIKARHIRNMYALRLGYSYYLNENSPDTYTVVPVWVCDCDYTESANEELMKNILSDDYRKGLYFSQIIINAQTGKMESKWLNETDMLYTPEIIKWNERH